MFCLVLFTKTSVKTKQFKDSVENTFITRLGGKKTDERRASSVECGQATLQKNKDYYLTAFLNRYILSFSKTQPYWC